MSEAKHTPGPWMATPNQNHWNDVCTVYGTEEGWIGIGNVEAIPAEHRAQQSANARLIAAAPEQHEALCMAPVLSMYHGANGFELERFIKDYEAWSEQKRVAIAKATGGAA